MKNIIEKIKQEKTKIVESVTCDMCGEKSNSTNYSYTDIVNFGTYDENVRRTCVSYEYGNRFPDGGFGEKIVVDLCPECFMNILIPFLKEKGVNIKIQDCDL